MKSKEIDSEQVEQVGQRLVGSTGDLVNPVVARYLDIWDEAEGDLAALARAAGHPCGGLDSANRPLEGFRRLVEEIADDVYDGAPGRWVAEVDGNLDAAAGWVRTHGDPGEWDESTSSIVRVLAFPPGDIDADALARSAKGLADLVWSAPVGTADALEGLPEDLALVWPVLAGLVEVLPPAMAHRLEGAMGVVQDRLARV